MGTKNRLFIPGYKRLEYIESTGTQYIDTDVFGTLETKISTECVALENPIISLLGSYHTANDSITVYGGTSSTSRFGNASVTGLSIPLNVKQIVSIDKTGVTIGSTKTQWAPTMEFTTYSTLCIMGRNGVTTGSFEGRTYNAQIWDNSTLVRDFIPVQRISDNAIGMYDAVNKQFYGNSGSGVFVAGPELRMVGWIESSGTQYIDTGLIYGKFVHDIQFNRTGTRQLMGTNGSAANFWGMNSGNTSFDFGSYGISYSPLDRNIVEYTRFENENGVLTVKDRTVSAVPTSTPTTNYKLLGGLGTDYNCSAKVYSLKTYNSSNTLVRDFVPVLVGTEYAMFDLVTNTVYRNAGTGVFSGGPLVPDPAFMPFTSMRLSRYANATSADTTKYPQTLNGCARKVLDGTESWGVTTTDVLQADVLTNDAYGEMCVSSHLTYTTSSTFSNMPDNSFKNGSSVYATRLYVKSSTLATDVTTWKTYLNAQHENGTPVTVLYPLATSDGSVWNFVCDTATKTKNLVDFNETRIDLNTWATADKTKGFEIVADIYGKSVGNSLGANKNCFGVFAPCTKGESVSIDFFNYAPYYGRCFYCEVDTDFKVLTTPVQFAGSSSLTQKTFTATNDNCIGFAIEWFISSAQTRDYTKENYMVVSGTTVPTAYESYGNIFGYRNQATGEFVKAFGATGTISSYNKIDFLSARFKQNKNLFSGIFEDGWGISSTDGSITYREGRKAFYVPVEAGQAYTVSRSAVGTASYFYYGTYENEPYTDGQACVSFENIGNTALSKTITIPNGANYLAAFFGTGTSTNVQLEKGSSATPYEPYSCRLIQFTNRLYK